MSTTPDEKFRFEQADHSYWLGSIRLPSVTQVLRGIGIIDDEHFNERARSRGAAVHAATAFLDEGRLDWNSLHLDLHGYVRAWNKFKVETKCEIIDIEVPAFDPVLLYAGTRDRRLLWNGYEWVIDIKTIGTPGGAGPRWGGEQTAAYERLLPPSSFRNRKRASIFLYPDESWKPKFHDDFSDEKYFLAYLTVFRRLIHHRRIKADGSRDLTR
jgi:hypothetical protein